MDTCVICGKYVPEGSQVCKECQDNPIIDAKKRFYLLCGPAGSGKSTFARDILIDSKNDIIVSRDDIRFSLLEEKDSYFEKEEVVFEEFIKNIQAALDKKASIVIADAMHLTEKARNKVLDRLNWEGYELIAVNFRTPLNVCLERNVARDGLRRVPNGIVKRHYFSFVPATRNEKYKYKVIIDV